MVGTARQGFLAAAALPDADGAAFDGLASTKGTVEANKQVLDANWIFKSLEVTLAPRGGGGGEWKKVECAGEKHTSRSGSAGRFPGAWPVFSERHRSCGFG